MSAETALDALRNTDPRHPLGKSRGHFDEIVAHGESKFNI